MEQQWDINKIREAAETATSIREFLSMLDLPAHSGNYRRARTLAAKANVTLPVYNPSAHLETLRKFKSTPDDIYFSNSDILRHGPQTKRRLIRDHDFKDMCSECGIDSWQGKSLTLQVDHIDGNRFNNLISNLRLLCPNCHSQTSTYGNSHGSQRPRYSYCVCGRRKLLESVTCKSCSNKTGTPRFNWPPIEEVLELVRKSNFRQAAKSLGASDNGIRKFLARNGIDVATLQYVE